MDQYIFTIADTNKGHSWKVFQFYRREARIKSSIRFLAITILWDRAQCESSGSLLKREDVVYVLIPVFLRKTLMALGTIEISQAFYTILYYT